MEFLPEIPCTMPTRLPEHEDDAGDGEIELTLTLSPLGRRSGKSSDASRRRSPAEAPKDAPVGVIGEERVAMEASMSESRARDRAAREVEYGDERCVDDRKGPAAAGVFAHAPYVGHVMPYQTHQQVQYVPVPVPVPNGFGLPYLMPYWAPTMSAAADACRMENASQPLAFGRFPVPVPAVTAGGGCVMVPTDAPGAACVVPPAESPGSSSSGISDHRSVSLLGVNASSSGSSDSMKSPSSNLMHKNAAAAQPRRQPSKCENVRKQTPGNAVSAVKSRSPSAVAAATPDKSRFPNKTKAVVGAPPGLSSSRMPCVWTTGSGPNGRTVTGLLHKYDKSGVSIVCTCHGTSLSPAEFVRHAGGGDVAHPMRHIVMVNSISTTSRVL